MKHFAQALSQLIKQSTLNIRCSEIAPNQARSLFHKTVKIKERKSKIVFEAFVTDYCGEDEFGIIVAFDKKVAATLSNKDFHPADFNSKKFVEMDLRKKFSGKDFDLVG